MQIDEEAEFDAHFRRHAGHVHSFALRRSGPQAAQDVTAETFLIAWRRRAEMPIDPLPWLYGIARGVLANEARSERRQGALQSRMAGERAPAPTAESHDHEILEALAALREDDREALLLCAWEGLSTREAAVALGCRPATFAVRLHRARGRLARVLAEMAGDDGPIPTRDAVPEVQR